MKASSHNLATIAAFSLAVGTTQLAYAGEEKQVIDALSPASLAPTFLINAQSKFKISDHGNIVSFEGPTGYEHIANGTIGEGYVLCYDGKTAYDVGETEVGFAFPVTSCSGSTCTVTRNTTDGRLQLKQVITGVSSERGLAIEMTLKNLQFSNRTNVVLRRQVDFDVDTGGTKGTGSFNNRFASGERDSVFAWNAPNDHVQEDHALVLKHVSQTPDNFSHLAKVTNDILDKTCSPANIAATGAVLGDFGATLQYNVGTIFGGALIKTKVEYQRN